MKKVKFITNICEYNMEIEVNQFIASHNVLDIQYQYIGDKYKRYSVMIVYEE